MGNYQSNYKNINFEDLQYAIDNNYTIINTMNIDEQEILIINTIKYKDEERIINNYINNNNLSINIVIYGKNCNDYKIYNKAEQLIKLGFINIYIYTGGLFEWLLLQDIYGYKLFQTTKKELDILKYKQQKVLNVQLISNY